MRAKSEKRERPVMDITKDLRLKIIGLGKVGMSIAQALAQSGFSVQGMDVDQGNIDRGLKKVGLNLDAQVNKGKINPEERSGILSRIALSTDLGCISDGDVVIEAVFEDMDMKKETFRKMDEVVASKEALLLTNTSSLSVTEIASVTQRPEKVAGMHFFNPVPIMKLVEVVKGAMTADETVEQVKALARLMGKTPIVSADSPGFIVNRMLNALVVEATRIVEEGVGTVEDVDTGAKLGLGHPMGPLELIDYLNAIHLLQHVTDTMAVELGERFCLPVWVKNLVRAGKVGRESGRGFYDYPDTGR
ncbi:MAG: 3-hydroxyacyl-CoA dehydrogenase family protein [Desulfobacterales bacterium]|nr:3-hydroxyacyl-CoA dehydrogenase family protein [Desulfobacterales bacterium]